MEEVEITVKIRVPFRSYGTKRKNQRAKNSIKRWIRWAVENDCGFIPLYVERDDNGAVIEDCSRKTSIKIV